MASFRIQNLQWFGAAIAAACGLLLGGSALLASLNDYHRADAGVSALSRFQQILAVAAAVSSERGPANSAMGADTDHAERTLAALSEKRRLVDAEMVKLRAAFAPQIATNETLGSLLDSFDFALSVARRTVDSVIVKPPAERTGSDLIVAIEAMFRVSDIAAQLRGGVARRVMETTPQITTELMLGTAASEMRELQGRLGSYVVMTLRSGARQDIKHLQSIAETQTTLRQLRTILNNYTASYLGGEKIQDLIKHVDIDYFDNSLTYARRTAETHEAQGPISALEFTEHYVPGMASSEQLRDEIMIRSMERLEQARDMASTAVIRSAMLTGVMVMVLFGLGLMFRRILFDPLTEVREQILAVSAGDLSEPPPMRPFGKEIGEMLAGVAVLRRQQREKVRLETEQRRLTQRLKTLAETDTLTGLPNRRTLRDVAESLFEQADADQQTIAVIMVDVDHFKAVNDTLGHSMGDVVLQTIGKVLPPLLRSQDIMARYGGEEFVILLRNTSPPRAYAIAERLRVTLARTIISREHGLSVTASFGVALRDPASDQHWDSVVAIADRRLYAAKRAGRNRVCMSDDPPLTRASA